MKEPEKPANRDFAPREAAQYLGVSLNFLQRELDAGRLPYRVTASHLRIEEKELADYSRRMRASQQAALDQMAQNAQDLGLDY